MTQKEQVAGVRSFSALSSQTFLVSYTVLQHFTFSSSGITQDLDVYKRQNGDIVSNVRFTGGCNGNLQGISSLTDGLTVEQIENKLKGIRCGFKPTSCPDQLAIAVREAYESENK